VGSTFSQIQQKASLVEFIKVDFYGRSGKSLGIGWHGLRQVRKSLLVGRHDLQLRCLAGRILHGRILLAPHAIAETHDDVGSVFARNDLDRHVRLAHEANYMLRDPGQVVYFDLKPIDPSSSALTEPSS
jgi:hypothetical protein